jgi:hypothetical protein
LGNPPTNTKLISVNPEPCRELREVADNQGRVSGKDSLYIFLNIHHCVCKKVTDSHPHSIRILNECLVRICLDRVRNYKVEALEDPGLPKGWRWSLRSLYKALPNAIPVVLPAIVMAHIFEDLPNALCEAERVIAGGDIGLPLIKQIEYERVITDLLRCIKEAFTEDPLIGMSFVHFLRRVTYISGLEFASLVVFRQYAWMKSRQYLAEELRRRQRKQVDINPPPS